MNSSRIVHPDPETFKAVLSDATDDDRLKFGERLVDLYFTERTRTRFWKQQARFYCVMTFVWLAIAVLSLIMYLYLELTRPC